MSNTLYYFHDPMCSWCYAFQPTLKQISEQLPEGVGIIKLLGGLAVDSDEPMPGDMQQNIQDGWQRIVQRVPGTQFNFDFWNHCKPRRSTYPACRAVIAARLQGSGNDELMTQAIQRAYYQQARNPSDNSTLIELAVEIGLNEKQFHDALLSDEVDELLKNEIETTGEMHIDSFPSMVLKVDESFWPVAVEYTDPQKVLESITFLLEN